MAHFNYPYDADLQLKDAGLVAADGAATVASVAKIIDLGDVDVKGDLVIDVTAVEVATGDEGYLIILEGSDSSDFSTGTPRILPLCIAAMGDSTTIPGAGATDTSTGRFVLPFTNNVNGTRSRYVRIYTDVQGTIATGINFSAYLSNLKPA